MTIRYAAPLLDAAGKAAISGALWSPQHDLDPAKTWALRQGFADGDARPLYRFEVREDDVCWIDAGQARNRSELSCAHFNPPYLSEQWISCAMRIGPGAASRWNVLMQFHEGGDQPAGTRLGGSPPFALELAHTAKGDMLQVRRRADFGTLDELLGARAAARRGAWRRLVARVVFDPVGSRGVVQVWLDGKVWVAKTGIRIGYDQPVAPYLKFGWYRARVPGAQAIEFANLEYAVGASLAARIDAPLPIPT